MFSFKESILGDYHYLLARQSTKKDARETKVHRAK
jgi:hypothetical protein